MSAGHVAADQCLPGEIVADVAEVLAGSKFKTAEARGVGLDLSAGAEIGRGFGFHVLIHFPGREPAKLKIDVAIRI